MVVRVQQFPSDMGIIDLHLLLRPRLGGAELGHEEHCVSLHTVQPVMKVDSSKFFLDLISGPGSNGPFHGFLVNVDESSFLD